MSYEAVQTPRPDMLRASAQFITEHADHEFYFSKPYGQLGVFAECVTCHAAIHHPDYTSRVHAVLEDTARHDALCSLGTPAGDQTMPCDCDGAPEAK